MSQTTTKSSRTNEPTRDGEIHNERPNEMQGKQQQESLYEASALLILRSKPFYLLCNSIFFISVGSLYLKPCSLILYTPANASVNENGKLILLLLFYFVSHFQRKKNFTFPQQKSVHSHSYTQTHTFIFNLYFCCKTFSEYYAHLLFHNFRLRKNKRAYFGPMSIQVGGK